MLLVYLPTNIGSWGGTRTFDLVGWVEAPRNSGGWAFYVAGTSRAGRSRCHGGFIQAIGKMQYEKAPGVILFQTRFLTAWSTAIVRALFK